MVTLHTHFTSNHLVSPGFKLFSPLLLYHAAVSSILHCLLLSIWPASMQPLHTWSRTYLTTLYMTDSNVVVLSLAKRVWEVKGKEAFHWQGRTHKQARSHTQRTLFILTISHLQHNSCKRNHMKNKKPQTHPCPGGILPSFVLIMRSPQEILQAAEIPDSGRSIPTKAALLSHHVSDSDFCSYGHPYCHDK